MHPVGDAECTVCVFTDTVTTTGGTFSARVVHVTSRQQFQSLGWVADVFGGDFSSVNVGSTSSMRTEVAATDHSRVRRCVADEKH